MQRSERLADLGQRGGRAGPRAAQPARLHGRLDRAAQGRARASATRDARLMDIVLREAARLEQLVAAFLAFSRPAPPRRGAGRPRSRAVAETLEVFANDPARGAGAAGARAAARHGLVRPRPAPAGASGTCSPTPPTPRAQREVRRHGARALWARTATARVRGRGRRARHRRRRPDAPLHALLHHQGARHRPRPRHRAAHRRRARRRPSRVDVGARATARASRCASPHRPRAAG